MGSYTYPVYTHNIYNKIYSSDPFFHYKLAEKRGNISGFVIGTDEDYQRAQEAAHYNGQKISYAGSYYDGSKSIDTAPYSQANMRCWSNTIKIQIKKATLIFINAPDDKCEILQWAMYNIAKGGYIVSRLPPVLDKHHTDILYVLSTAMDSTVFIPCKDALYISCGGYKGVSTHREERLELQGLTDAISEQLDRINQCDNIRVQVGNYRGNRKVYKEALIAAIKG